MIEEARGRMPSDVAAMAGGDVLLASQTGSGKTLAYLLPLVQPHCRLL